MPCHPFHKCLITRQEDISLGALHPTENTKSLFDFAKFEHRPKLTSVYHPGDPVAQGRSGQVDLQMWSSRSLGGPQNQVSLYLVIVIS